MLILSCLYAVVYLLMGEIPCGFASQYPVDKGSQIMLLIGENRYTANISDVRKLKCQGDVFGFQYVSIFSVGLCEPVLAAVRDEQEIKYKILGTGLDIIGSIEPEHLSEAKKLLGAA